MNNMPSPAKRYLWALVPLVPVAGYLIYRNLTPEQKKKFKESVSKGAFGMISATFNQLMDAYRHNRPVAIPDGAGKNGISVPKMAAMPSADESETTGGDERW